MNLSFATSSLAASSPPPPLRRRRGHRVGVAAAIPEPIAPPLLRTDPSSIPTIPIPAICDNAQLINNVMNVKATAVDPRTVVRSLSNAENDNVKELVVIYKKDNSGDAIELFNKMLQDNKPLPWTVWTSAQEVLSKASYTVTVPDGDGDGDDNSKLLYGNKEPRKEVLTIENWHSTFVHVYNTDAKFARRRGGNLAMDSKTATEVAQIISKTYSVNIKLLAKCILATDSPPTSTNSNAVNASALDSALAVADFQPSVVTQPSSMQSNGNTLVATSTSPNALNAPALDSALAVADFQPSVATQPSSMQSNGNALVATITNPNVVNAFVPGSFPVVAPDQSVLIKGNNLVNAPHTTSYTIDGNVSVVHGDYIVNNYPDRAEEDSTIMEQFARDMRAMSTKLDTVVDHSKHLVDNSNRTFDIISSSAQKQRPTHTQPNEIGLLGRTNSVDERMVGGGSPLRSITEHPEPCSGEYSPGNDIVGRVLQFGANPSELGQVNEEHHDDSDGTNPSGLGQSGEEVNDDSDGEDSHGLYSCIIS